MNTRENWTLVMQSHSLEPSFHCVVIRSHQRYIYTLFVTHSVRNVLALYLQVMGKGICTPHTAV